MSMPSQLPLKEEAAQITSGTCRLRDAEFEASDVKSFGSVARTFGPHWALKIALVILGVLAVSSAVRGIMTDYWIATVVSTVLAVPLFFLASLNSTRVLAVELSDGRRIEYVGTSNHILRVEAAIGLATMPMAAETQAAPAT